MALSDAWSPYNSDLDEMENKFALAFINRRPDDKTVATMAPIGTNIKFAPKNKPFSESFQKFFHNSYEPSYNTSLEMGFSFTDYDIDAKFAGSSTVIKKLFMEPYRAGPLSLFCHRIGETIYVDMDDHIIDESFKEKVQELSEGESYIPSYNAHSGLMLYENLIWNCKEASDVWREKMGIFSTTELALDVPKSTLLPMFDSYSYKIQPQNSLNGEAYIWEFHNTKMLIDSELPIFGGGEYPALSIRLSEGTGAQPISVLTGVDMLLDQLIHNIKETIVVHHSEGNVQKYDVVVQNKIPYLEGSEFDSTKLQNITSNMYNFLNSNMTQQGHTYWLCRETNSDELRLYDLTAICPEHAKNRHKNPFLMPVVNLMYKIACKLIKQTEEHRTMKVTNVAWGLLTATDKLIETAHIPEFRACINYLLAGIYLQHHAKILKKNLSDDQDELLRGLTEETFQGYTKFPGTIKVDDLLTEIEKETSAKDDMSHAPVHKIVYTIPNIKLKLESATQALEYCKEGLMHLEKCRHDDEDIPYVADNLDDFNSLNEHEHPTGDTIFSHLRHALLNRTALCFLIMATNAALLNKGFKMYKFGHAGLVCCSSVLSSLPSKIHDSAAKAMIAPLGACFLKSLLFLSDSVSDASVLEHNYIEKIVLKIATDYVNILDRYNFTRFWQFKSRKIAFEDWSAKAEIAAIKLLTLMEEDYPPTKRKLTYKPMVEASFEPFDAASNIAQSICDFAANIVNKVQREMVGMDQPELAEYFHSKGDDSVKLAVEFYDKAIQMIEFCPNVERFNKLKAIMFVNAIVPKKLKIVSATSKKVPFEESNRLAEDVLGYYHRAFSYMPTDLKTSTGIDIHVRCLLEYTDNLLGHMSHWAVEMEKYYPGKRRAYFESVIRNYDIIYKAPPEILAGRYLADLSFYKSHVLFMLLKINSEELNIPAMSEPLRSSAASKKMRKAVKEFLTFFESCLTHLKALADWQVFASKKTRPEAHFCNELIPFYSSPHLSGADKVGILKLSTAWAKVMLECGIQETPEEIKAAKAYALKVTIELKTLASGIKPVVDKNSKAKLEKIEKIIVLKNTPKDDKEFIKLICSKFEEALAILS